MTKRAVILVVDDDEPILLLMRNLLREFGFEPVVARSGAAAIDQARQHHPDLILLDRNMPGMNGDEVLREIRSISPLVSTPVLILSGQPLRKSEIEALGATDAILKPFDVAALVETIRRHLAERDIGG